jgi:hypothetical protein
MDSKLVRCVMLESKKTAVALNEEELVELQSILIDSDEREAFRFLKESVYDKVMRTQQGK